MHPWIEKPDGSRVEIAGSCFFGRAAGNTIVLKSPGTSRRHAQIHAQSAVEGLEYWIVDLGSTNGTSCNGRRVTIPCRLVDGDVIACGEESFVFRLPRPVEDQPRLDHTLPAATMKMFRPELCWLLMLDIKRFTKLACQLAPESLSLTVGAWFRRCRDAIESRGGTIDKFLGDAVFAYWKHGDAVAAQVADTLSELTRLQQARDPDFRIVLHLGQVALEGGVGGANNLSGPEVIYTFRMEKVCSRLDGDSIVSTRAQAALVPHWQCATLGRKRLEGFAAPHEMFRLVVGPQQADTVG